MKIKSIKLRTIGYSFILAFMWILFALNTVNVDMDGYRRIYEFCESSKHYSGVEIGFTFLMNVSNRLGFTYAQFWGIVATFILFVISWFIERYAINKIYVVLLFLLYPYIVDITVIRNFIAMAIVLWAIHFLIKEEIGKRDIVKYIVSVFVASLFHRIALVYLLLIMIKFEYSKLKYYINILILIESVFIFVFTDIFKVLERFIPKLSVYLESGLQGTKFYTKIFLFLYLVLMIAFEKYVFLHPTKFKNNEHAIFNKQALKILRVTDLFIPICVFEMDFYRIPRNMLLIFYIVMCNHTVSGRSGAFKIKLIGVILIGFVITLSYVLLFMNSYNSIVKVIFQNNLLWGENY